MKKLPEYVSFAIVKVKEPVKESYRSYNTYISNGLLSIYNDEHIIFKPDDFTIQFDFDDKVKLLVPYCFKRNKYASLCKTVNSIIGKKIRIILPDHYTRAYKAVENDIGQYFDPQYVHRNASGHLIYQELNKEPVAVYLDEFNIKNWHGIMHEQLDKLLDNLFKDITIKEFLANQNYIFINDKGGLPKFTKLVNNTGSAYNAGNVIGLYYMLGDKMEVNHYVR